MPPERLPVQVVGAVPCNNSYRHVEDFVVFELEEKKVCECAWRLLFKPVIAVLRTAPSPSPQCLLPTLPGAKGLPKGSHHHSAAVQEHGSTSELPVVLPGPPSWSLLAALPRTHRIRVEFNGCGVFAAADAAVTFHFAAEPPPAAVQLRVRPVALSIWRQHGEKRIPHPTASPRVLQAATRMARPGLSYHQTSACCCEQASHSHCMASLRQQQALFEANSQKRLDQASFGELTSGHNMHPVPHPNLSLRSHLKQPQKQAEGKLVPL